MRPERPGGYCLGPSGCIPERRGLVAGKPHTPGSGARETGPKGRGEQRRIPNWPWHPARVWAPRCLLPRAPSPRGAAPCRPRWGVPRRASQALVRGGRSPRSARLSSTPGARQAPGPLLSGQRDPPIGALGPALGRWILAPHTHRASLPRFAARADWLQYRTPKPNQRLQPPLPPPLPLPRKMAKSNKGESGLPPTASAQAPLRPRPLPRARGSPHPRRSNTAQAYALATPTFLIGSHPAEGIRRRLLGAPDPFHSNRALNISSTQALSNSFANCPPSSLRPLETHPLGLNAQAPLYRTCIRLSRYACPGGSGGRASPPEVRRPSPKSAGSAS